jgi:uncharacterized protein (TIGR03086 family)
MTNAMVLLASSISYALGAVALVTPRKLSLPTPCADWNLGALLRHLADSLTAIDEALVTGIIGMSPESCRDDDPVELVRDRAADLLYSAFTTSDLPVLVGGLPVPAEMIVTTGAVEIAVHGWDISVACGCDRAVPEEIARPLIPRLPELVAGRNGLFGSPVTVPPCASPGSQLVAYLGRDPGGTTLVTGE